MNTESACESAFRRNGPFWHLYTSGETMEIIFAGVADFLFGITLLGICAAAFPRCRILTFALMNNHLHVILAGSREDVLDFFQLYKKRLQRYISTGGRDCSLRRFEADVFCIPDVKALRNEIVYVNRNGYVVHPDATPYSYWWSAGVFYFNPLARILPVVPFTSLTLRQRREMCHCREVSLPDRYSVLTVYPPVLAQGGVAGMLNPADFCALSEGEAYFRDAHHYFARLSKDHEAHAEVARRLGDKLFLTDDELYKAICSISSKEYGLTQPGLLQGGQKLELARKMHFDYNASNNQIRRILKLPQDLVDTMFPKMRCSSSDNG